MSDITVSPLEIFCLGSSIAFAGLFYYLRGQKQKEVDELLKIPRFKVGEHLKQVLKTGSGGMLCYAVVEGKVQAIGEPLQSVNFVSCLGVLQKIIKKEQKKTWNPLTRTWVFGEYTVNEVVNSVPFKLVPSAGDNNVSVHVINPLSAAGLYLEPVRELTHKAKEGFLYYLNQYISKEKPIGILEVEEMLQVGSTVTGIGELISSDNVIKLQPPSNGKDYLLIASDFKSFLSNQETVVNMWKIFTAVCGLFGASIFAVIVYRIYHQTKRPEK
ncbi:mitochondrial ubiquitin ligase activator of nfkb 1-A-like [Protopterus annectens]|uniref:mitochondrial ubiquitin ligase activator of nfkb 1-A-like n=1 Tax=Protopterus annectens TaxID=7888 RepID=UPI001CFB54E4|nr:mitochondrial ubiquitin ligase activator of nfkb 1-A-like [Protopterus annectens]